jgi:hypothetical protein
MSTNRCTDEYIKLRASSSFSRLCHLQIQRSIVNGSLVKALQASIQNRSVASFPSQSQITGDGKSKKTIEEKY